MICDACQKGKSHQLSYPCSTSVSSAPLELIFSHVLGPGLAFVGSYKYYVCLLMILANFHGFICLKVNMMFFQNFHDFQHHVEPLSVVVQSDLGGEYLKCVSGL